MGAAAVLVGHDALAAIVPTSIGPSGANPPHRQDCAGTLWLVW